MVSVTKGRRFDSCRGHKRKRPAHRVGLFAFRVLRVIRMPPDLPPASGGRSGGIRFSAARYLSARSLKASMLLPAPWDLPGALTAFTVELSKANVRIAAATASEFTSSANVLMFPMSS